MLVILKQQRFKINKSNATKSKISKYSCVDANNNKER